MRHTVHPKHKKAPQNSGIDTLALIIGVLQPLMTLPQIYLAFSTQDVSGLSLFMWIAWDIASVILLIYGLKHKLMPIIAAQILWLVVQTPIIIAIVLFS